MANPIRSEKKDGAPPGAFTLVELMAAVAVVSLLLGAILATFSYISKTYQRSGFDMTALAQARFALDRIGSDLATRPNRSDLPVQILSQSGNDSLLFYAAVPSASPPPSNNRGLALVSYRISEGTAGGSYELQRAADGVSWDNTSPLVTVSATAPPAITPPADADYDVASESVFRMECCTIDSSGNIKATAPTDPLDFVQNVSAILVTVAALDPKARMMLTNANAQLGSLVGQFQDATDGALPAAAWEQKVKSIDALASATNIPVKVLSSLRISSRTYYVK